MKDKIEKLQAKYQKKMDKLLDKEWDRDDNEVSYLQGAIEVLDEVLEIVK